MAIRFRDIWQDLRDTAGRVAERTNTNAFEAALTEPGLHALAVYRAASWLHAQGLRRVLLVSDPFHMFRLRLEARRISLEAYTSPTESSPISDNPVLELRYLFAEGLKVPVAWLRSLIPIAGLPAART